MGILSPAKIAENYVEIGRNKCQTALWRIFLLAIMAGAFIALAGIGATTAAVSVKAPSVGKFLGACVFPGGLAMVVLAGGELFTGNCLLPLCRLEKQVTVGQILANWCVVLCGNFVGAMLVCFSLVFSHQLRLFGGELLRAVMLTANAKCSLTFTEALLRGCLCNFMVALAVWITFGAQDMGGKVLGLFFPIMIFVVCGFEHNVANMYYIGVGLVAKLEPLYKLEGLFPAVTWKNFLLKNLLPVTLGNIIGGGFIAAVYWGAFLAGKKKA